MISARETHAYPHAVQILPRANATPNSCVYGHGSRTLGRGEEFTNQNRPNLPKSWGLEHCIPRLDMLGMFFRIFLGILGIVCIRFWHGSPWSIFSTVRSAVKSNLGSKSQDVTGINIYIYICD